MNTHNGTMMIQAKYLLECLPAISLLAESIETNTTNHPSSTRGLILYNVKLLTDFLQCRTLSDAVMFLDIEGNNYFHDLVKTCLEGSLEPPSVRSEFKFRQNFELDIVKRLRNQRALLKYTDCPQREKRHFYQVYEEQLFVYASMHKDDDLYSTIDVPDSDSNFDTNDQTELMIWEISNTSTEPTASSKDHMYNDEPEKWIRCILRLIEYCKESNITVLSLDKSIARKLSRDLLNVEILAFEKGSCCYYIKTKKSLPSLIIDPRTLLFHSNPLE
ncbi:hypothetical protein [Vibrio superstes]|uniref:Uncharacterized protein n=1 Tax=Vibrio superstes NBRC 103154 TaxID=1219062 RepID=A0A511QP88_9VIBR|nr:hypothetical protein [Vibrio superstes]GEM78746.1 hypothetical protein VSU01S_09910 [Vibrio superstes NBRC 103154]